MKTLARPRDTAELLQRVRALRPDSVRRWGRMSVHQMVCHLCDGFRMGMGEKPVRRQIHPLFGRMSEAAWLRWGYLHVDHHLRQFGA